MTVKQDNRDALAHGKITTAPLREKPSIPTWALKLTMAISGIIFALFVLVHMVGNLKIYMGAEHLDEYAHFLRAFGEPLLPYESFLWIFRITLLVALVAHIYAAFVLKSRAAQSRGSFKRKNMVSSFNTFTARSMLVTGVVLLLFVIFHLLDLTIGAQPIAPEGFEHLAAAANLTASFQRPLVAVIYILAMVVLFLHLSHGLWTVVSDLGISGRRWRAILLFISGLLPLVVMLGNISIPLAIMLGWNPVA